jgi:hypothetical protein
VWINGSSGYAAFQGSNEFEQPNLTSALLQKIKTVNNHILKEVCSGYLGYHDRNDGCKELTNCFALQIHLTKDYHIDRHSAVKGTSLSKLLDIGIKDSYTSQKVIEALLEEAGNSR